MSGSQMAAKTGVWWQVKLCDPTITHGPYLSDLIIGFLTYFTFKRWLITYLLEQQWSMNTMRNHIAREINVRPFSPRGQTVRRCLQLIYDDMVDKCIYVCICIYYRYHHYYHHHHHHHHHHLYHRAVVAFLRPGRRLTYLLTYLRSYDPNQTFWSRLWYGAVYVRLTITSSHLAGVVALVAVCWTRRSERALSRWSINEDRRARIRKMNEELGRRMDERTEVRRRRAPDGRCPPIFPTQSNCKWRFWDKLLPIKSQINVQNMTGHIRIRHLTDSAPDYRLATGGTVSMAYE